MILYNCGPKCCDNGSLAAKTLSNQMKDYMGYVQRLSPWGRVKPQANGGRKIPHLYGRDEDMVLSYVKA